MFIFHTDASICPVEVAVNSILFMRPGTMNTDTAANAGIARYQAPGFAVVEPGIIIRCGLVEHHKTVPFLMNPLVYNPEMPFRCAFITFHIFILEVIAAKNHGIGDQPAGIIIHMQLVPVLFYDDIKTLTGMPVPERCVAK